MTQKYISDGTCLAEALRLPVAEGRFHIDGTFYKRPDKYPCAFFDRRGYTIVESETALEEIATVSGARANIQPELSKRPGYQLGQNWKEWPVIARARQSERAKVSKARRLLSGLTEQQRWELLDKLKGQV